MSYRAPRVIRNTRTEVHADRRTRRQRTRAAEAASELQSIWEDEYLLDDEDLYEQELKWDQRGRRS